MEASASGSSHLTSFSTRTPMNTITATKSRAPPITRQIVGKLRLGCAISVMSSKNTGGLRLSFAYGKSDGALVGSQGQVRHRVRFRAYGEHRRGAGFRLRRGDASTRDPAPP